MATNDEYATGSPKGKILREAKDRFQRCVGYESYARVNFINDYKFANGDAYNMYQWPDDVRLTRGAQKLPCLTTNMVRQHNLQIINDAKQNKPGVKIIATGGDASYQSAQMLQALVRHIEYRSDAQAAYDRASEFQVTAGIGWLQVKTAYINDKSFDQEILIRGIRDPLSVYIDPDCKQPDKSDAKFAFIFDRMARKDFDRKYPQYASVASQSVLGFGADSWFDKDQIRIAEYFRKVEKKVKLYQLSNGKTFLESEIDNKDVLEAIKSEATNVRTVEMPSIEHIVIVGNKIAETSEWPGKYIPLIPVIGEEVWVEGKMDRKGHTRALLDQQRMFNYWSSSAVEYGVLQSKTPWIAPVAAIEEVQGMWNTANTNNYSVLPWKHIDDEGNSIPAPVRAQPPVASPVALTGMQIAQQEMMRASGQFESQLGEQGNERSYVAINARQRQGDRATYHYIDNLALAIKFLGKILLDLIPKIYDSPRLLMVSGMDGETFELKIDPSMGQAYSEEQDEKGKIAARALNPKLGEYDVEADVGPAFATKRQEAFEAFKLILTQNPDLTSLIGDIAFRAGDFPMAEEAAQRLRRMVPAQALGEGPTPEEQQLQQANTNLQDMLKFAMDELGALKTELKGVRADKQIDAFKAASEHEVDTFKALTERFKVIADAKTTQNLTDAEVKVMLFDAINDALRDNIQETSLANPAHRTTNGKDA